MDGWMDGVGQMQSAQWRAREKRQPAILSGPGLVHLKAYVLRWETQMRL